MDPIDVKKEMLAECREEVPDVKLPRRRKRAKVHPDCRFRVVHNGPGGMVACWTVREAIKLAQCTKASYAAVYVQDELIAVFYQLPFAEEL